MGLAALMAGLLFSSLAYAGDAPITPSTVPERWTAAKANEWYAAQPWLVGCNFLPSTAVNDVEMWQAESFDAATIERELGWAHDLGFNTVRVFLNYVVWEADADGLKKRFDQFLAIADKQGVWVMPILFDDCFKPEPRVGKQDEPVPGVHNSQWVRSPGVRRVADQSGWPMLEKYVKDMVGTFRQDRRVVIWDLYNEPARTSLPLVEATFRWAREVGHDQPLTTCVYGGSADPKRLGEISDVISFHEYSSLANTKEVAGQLLALGRPVLCTEWMARTRGSRFETHLPFFKENKIACWNWGFVAGRTQTHFPWGSKPTPGATEPALWFHDILRKDGTPYDAREVEFIKVATGKLDASALPQREMLVPTAEKSPVPWRYSNDSVYRGWKSMALRSGLVELQVLPEIGGRIIQFKLGEKEFLWVNPQLAGQLPPANGLATDGGWFNVGGDKLWPAPQGWDNDRQWPGPPDAVLDGQPYRAELLDGGTALRLTSRDDPRSGIRFSRTIRPLDGRSGVQFEVTMTNVDTKPRRWGIWAHTQLAAAARDGRSFNPLMRAFCPLNPRSKFPRGYDVIFGEKDNSSFRADRERGLVCVDYRYRVGKIGVDSPAGWVATVDGACGAVFVQRFIFEPGEEYPDGSSVEFWHNGAGKIHAYNKDMVMPENTDENPYVFESEVLSPFAKLAPGESYSWSYEWLATNIGGDFPIVGCNQNGVIAEPLRASRASKGWRLTGRFGVFVGTEPHIEWRDGNRKLIETSPLTLKATPLAPLVLDAMITAPIGARSAVLIAGGELASVELL